MYKYLVFLSIVLSGCSDLGNKIYIKSVKYESDSRFDWYFYSLLSNFSRSYIDLVDKNNDSKRVFESFFVSDIRISEDTLTIQLYKNQYSLEKSFLQSKTIIISIDTTGGIWNQASSRLGRLQRKNANFYVPHEVDSFCPNGECN